ncbi:hypothetical protein FB45DRAFT_980684 [Roridomyces roridus]|uniref:RING-14 protein n=1 Tax=Roridomyces roridus TaxID=1738132 RepID=A0AAD7BHU8_9AGAR|nr:hypothetical protein FB45DRAFT_980684 [Roridomyces roridus]
MHFSKLYAQLLEDLPPELSENAFQYRQLKKLINQIATELSALGLQPGVLQGLLATSGKGKGKEEVPSVFYELNTASGNIEPRLRLWVKPPDAPPPPSRVQQVEDEDDDGEDASSVSQISLLDVLQRHPEFESGELVIPIVSDSAFFQLLATTLQGLQENLVAVNAQFVETLGELTRAVSESARPASSTSSSFKAFSGLRSDPGGVRVGTSSGKSDLNAWREIFALYIETEIFESISERDRGERSVADGRRTGCTTRGLGGCHQLKLQQSRDALESFLQLNIFILNVKKFELANAEATRKILKKRNKRHRAPIDGFEQYELAELGTTLLPVIPSLEDYQCFICMSLAFKPIRLACGHLFCVRCLVKMQKRGSGDCPICAFPVLSKQNTRSSFVLANVDWALLNFMRDWFPEEATIKLRQNEREAAQEQLEELGLPEQRCIVM